MVPGSGTWYWEGIPVDSRVPSLSRTGPDRQPQHADDSLPPCAAQAYPRGVPHLVAAFGHAAASHERSAAAHDRAAAFFAEHGKLDAAARELESARRDREGAAEDRERVRQRREQLGAGAPPPTRRATA